MQASNSLEKLFILWLYFSFSGTEDTTHPELSGGSEVFSTLSRCLPQPSTVIFTLCYFIHIWTVLPVLSQCIISNELSFSYFLANPPEGGKDTRAHTTVCMCNAQGSPQDSALSTHHIGSGNQTQAEKQEPFPLGHTASSGLFFDFTKPYQYWSIQI